MTLPGPGPEDLTARARIRDAALQHFTEHGFDRATIRGIAHSAGVSPALVRHHFGSKGALRRICDAHVLEISQRYNQQAMDGELPAEPGFTGTRAVLSPVQRYVARALVDGSPAAAELFEEMVGMSERWLLRQDELADEPPLTNARTRGVLLTAMTVGIPLLHEQVSRALGTDIFEPQGDIQVTLGMFDLYSRPLISAELAATVRAAAADLPAQQATPPRSAAPPSRGEAP